MTDSGKRNSYDYRLFPAIPEGSHRTANTVFRGIRDPARVTAAHTVSYAGFVTIMKRQTGKTIKKSAYAYSVLSDFCLFRSSQKT